MTFETGWLFRLQATVLIITTSCSFIKRLLLKEVMTALRDLGIQKKGVCSFLLHPLSKLIREVESLSPLVLVPIERENIQKETIQYPTIPYSLL